MSLTIITKHFYQMWTTGVLKGTQCYHDMLKPIQYNAIQTAVTTNCIPVVYSDTVEYALNDMYADHTEDAVGSL